MLITELELPTQLLSQYHGTWIKVGVRGVLVELVVFRGGAMDVGVGAAAWPMCLTVLTHTSLLQEFTHFEGARRIGMCFSLAALRWHVAAHTRVRPCLSPVSPPPHFEPADTTQDPQLPQT